ncbi:MAG: AI-2E family transporter [Rhodospirillales bacterium]|nr:AI-2E family transporter [Rhodospirillales bacterium]
MPSDDTRTEAEEQILEQEIRSEFHAEVETDGDTVRGTATGFTTETVKRREPVDPREDMPLPTEPRTIFLGGLFFMALFAVLYVAAEIILPVILAIVLKLLLQPLVRGLERIHVPRGVAAAFAVLLLLAALAGTASALAGPAASWAGKLPEALPQMRDKLAFLQRPIDAVQDMAKQLENFGGGEGGAPAPAPAHGSSLVGLVFSGTATATAGLFTTLLILFYLLVSGETFMRRLVEILPRFSDKRQAVELSLHVERDISAYLVTITLINGVVGVATGLVMWACGVANPLLWGVVAFVLNYVPILGPMVGLVIFLMASVLSLGVSWWALLPVGLYFAIHLIEGEFATPMLLARRFTINPVAVILALVFWYWMWGVPGAILAVPMLAIIKIVCDDLRPLKAFGHFLEA